LTKTQHSTNFWAKKYGCGYFNSPGRFPHNGLKKFPNGKKSRSGNLPPVENFLPP
jgi:hypothetical protein